MRRLGGLQALAAWAGLAAAAWTTAPEPAAASRPWPVSLVDVADRAGLRDPTTYGGLERKRFIIETNGSGVALLDYDTDGWLDALVLSGTRLQEGAREDVRYAPGRAPTNRLYRNRGDGAFADVTERAGLRRTGWASSVCVGDYDNDGGPDLFVTYFGTNVLYRNRGDGAFEDATAKANLPIASRRWGSGCTFVDYDKDGLVDLFVANYLSFDLASAPEPGTGANCLWKGIPVNCGPKGLPFDSNLLFHNEGDGSFRDVSERSGVARVSGRYPMTATAADLDGDAWTDVYVACDSTASILYRNQRDGSFSDVALASGVAYNEYGNAQAGMGLALGDYDADGLLDLLKTHFADDIPALYRNLGRGQFEDAAAAAGLGSENRYVEWGAGMPDLDNDGWQDVLYVTGNVYPELEARLPQYPHRGPRMVFRNLGGGRFDDVTQSSGPGARAPHSSRGAAFGDYDNDGDLDVLVMNMNAPPSLLRNDYAGGHGWLQVRLRGTRSNRLGLGALVSVVSGGRRQAQVVRSQSSYYSHDDLRLHFGLGGAARADEVTVTWPSGVVECWESVPARSRMTLVEGSGRTTKCSR